jgi:ribosomal protein S18 acetylase RimI-like enzyme
VTQISLPQGARLATVSDAAALTRLANRHDFRVQQETEPAVEHELREAIEGRYGPAHSVVIEAADGEISAAALINVDTTKGEAEIDMYGWPSDSRSTELLDYALGWLGEGHPTIRQRAYCNRLDIELTELLSSRGFELARLYWQMWRPLADEQLPKLPIGVAIRQIDWATELRLWNQLLYDSFEEHYGFVRRSFEEWHELLIRQNEDIDRDGVFVLCFETVPAAILVMGTTRHALNGGHVNQVGVLKEFRGRGFGDLLLRWAIGYEAQQGRDTIALSVDTANHTGALRVYEKNGFVPKVSWASFLRIPIGAQTA